MLTRMPKRSVCAEIGVYQGDFSAKILEIVEPRQLHLIDPWKYESAPTYGASWYGGKCGVDQSHMDGIHDRVVERFREPIAGGTVCVHRLDSSTASRGFPDGFFDWVYIDGNHLYQFVKDDLDRYYHKVKPGGFLAGDDYAKGDWWQGGVKAAVDEFVGTGLVEVVLLDKRQYCLAKKPAGLSPKG